MRLRARIDGNQNKIVEGLRKCGYSVQVLSMVGKGFPDILVGGRKRNVLLEIKDPAQPPSKRKLTADEQEFFDTWKGQVHKVESLEEALSVLSACIEEVERSKK